MRLTSLTLAGDTFSNLAVSLTPRLYLGSARQSDHRIDRDTQALDAATVSIKAQLRERWQQRDGRMRPEWLKEAANRWRSEWLWDLGHRTAILLMNA